MFRLCLFDLDNTLVSTDDVEKLRILSKNPDGTLFEQLTEALDSDTDRVIYSPELLDQIKAQFPDLMLGVFTRSPRRYADTVLELAYPGFEWDVLVAYGDVGRTKPYRDGIAYAMDKVGVKYRREVILVGDNDIDIRAAYHCGCLVALDKSDWPAKWNPEHWRAQGRMPDAVIENPQLIIEVLTSYERFLPELERLFENGGKPLGIWHRFDKIGHFIPSSVGGDNTSYPIYACGRSFANYASLEDRKKWHKLSQSIAEHKDATAFPREWLLAVRHFIEDVVVIACPVKKPDVIITAVPARPGRTPRLEHLLKQLKDYFEAKPIKNIHVATAPGLLAYKEGVKSQHGEHLGAHARFLNVRDHLHVPKSSAVDAKAIYLVIDDVVTTGASLIYAAQYLKEKGAADVRCLAFAKNVSDVLPKGEK
jgi:HAD superfamily hydrolase (TIGR01549 family)